MKISRRTTSVEDTQAAGEQLASFLRAGDILLLSGTLGAGKTAFTQGVARGLGVKERVTSPTFTLVRQHECSAANGIALLHHADVYRTNSLDEIEDLSLHELVETGGVAVIEWGEMAAPVLGRFAWRLSIDVVSDDEREIHIESESVGDRIADVTKWAAL